MTTEIATATTTTHHTDQHHHKSLNNTATDNNNNNTSVSSMNASMMMKSEQMEQLMQDPNFKFPLENSWSFWFYKNEKTKSWKENVKFITSIDFVEDFWGVYNHMQLVSRVSHGCDYMFFKKDIPPMWEDPQNSDGGRWTLNLEKNKVSQQSLDIYWLNTLLSLIGEQFDEDSEYVNGVWVNVRMRGNKIAVWTKNGRNAEVQLRIGNKIKEILSLKDQALVYELHAESDKKDSAPLYTL